MINRHGLSCGRGPRRHRIGRQDGAGAGGGERPAGRRSGRSRL